MINFEIQLIMIDSKKEICFTSFVFGSYQKYIPYYIFSVLTTYPNAYVKLFIVEPICSKVDLILRQMSKDGFDNFEILFHEFNDLNIFNEFNIKGGGSKTLFRWLFDFKYFKDFKYLYYGDLDVLILPEIRTLIETHNEIMIINKIPFSNQVRLNEKGELTQRLTGLHFVETEPYFNKMTPIINQILNDISFRKEIMYGVSRDEELLYKMNKQVFIFDDKKLSEFKRPIHGIHLGAIRNEKYIKIREEHLDSNQLSISFKALKSLLNEYYSKRTFRFLMKHMYLDEIYRLNDFLKLNNSIYWKFNYFYFNFLTKKALKFKVKKILSR